MLRNVIFDWSGTLIDDLPAVWEATNHVFSQAGLSPLSLEAFRDDFCLPFQKFYQRHTPHIPLHQLEEWYHGKFKQVQHQVRELPHARRFLEFCREQNLRTYVLSTIHRDHYAKQCAETGFDKLVHRPYIEAWDKREWIHRLLEENQLSPEETVFIGDMEHDIETAHHAGVFSCAVLTGYNGVSRLRAQRPHLIVEHLGELETLLRQSQLQFPPAVSPAPSVDRYPISTVGALIFNPQGEVLMIQTHKWSNLWGIPGGKIKWGEASEEALLREILEETALPVTDVRFVMVQDCIHSREFYRDAHFLLLNYTCRTEGDRVPDVRLNEEAQNFRWVAPMEALKMKLNVPTRILLEEVLRRQPIPSVPSHD